MKIKKVNFILICILFSSQFLISMDLDEVRAEGGSSDLVLHDLAIKARESGRSFFEIDCMMNLPLNKIMESVDLENLNGLRSDGSTYLHQAARANCKYVIGELLRLGADVMATTQTEKDTPLHFAAKYCTPDTIELLLNKRADIEASCLSVEDKVHGITPLMLAALVGKAENVIMLGEKGANIQAETSTGCTALHLACEDKKDTNIARYLLSKGAKVNATEIIAGRTPLHVASISGTLNTVILLVEAGANMHATTKSGFTPLHCSTLKNDDKIVAEYLLDNGAEINKKAKNGFTPLHKAAEMDRIEIVKLLLERKANPSAKVKYFFTPLDIAASQEIADILIEAMRKQKEHAKKNSPGFTSKIFSCFAIKKSKYQHLKQCDDEKDKYGTFSTQARQEKD